MIQIISKTLYILNDDIYLSIQGDCLLLKQEDKERLRLPLNAIEQIIIIGNAVVSNYLVKACSDSQIIISYLNPYGNFIGRFCGKSSGNVFIRKQQYSLYDNETESLDLMKNIILAKFLNCANLLKYYSRFTKEMDGADQLYKTSQKILEQSKNIKNMFTLDDLRGLEGAISSLYFKSFDLLLKTKDSDMKFETRSKHPPLNNCNALLSLFYTLLTMNVTAGLESFGLDSQLGYMHRMRSGRASLSCDIIEEFRAPIVDKFVIKLINLSQITSNDFEKTEDGIKLKKDSLSKVLKLWEAYKDEEVYHPLFKKNIKIRLLPYIQSQLFAQFIRGDIESYPPFYYKLS